LSDVDARLMALKCRTLAKEMSDEETVRALNALADEYDAQVALAEREATLGRDQATDPSQ
jgi:hypothetical protein